MEKVTFGDLTLEGYGLSERVGRLREAYFKAMPQICVERPFWLTRYHLEHGLFEKDRISVLDKAKAYRFALEKRTPVVWHAEGRDLNGKVFPIQDESLLAGSTTSKFKGVPLYPELMALALWPELDTMPRRDRNPYHIEKKEAELLNFEVFPRWMDRTILELAKARYAEGAEADFKLLEKLVFFLASKPNCISHTVPDFSRAVNGGLRAVIDEAAEKQSSVSDESQKEFYQAVMEVLEGIITYSHNLAAKAEEMARSETNEARKEQLVELARIHRHVPESAAGTFREGITTVWICWTAVHLENANVGLSLGRLDQLLYDLYRQDVEAGTLTVEQAIELVCCLWLKIGDHVPTVPEAGEQLFGGSGSNQAITIGGVDTQGRDAVNDLTYVMLKATELMMLRDPNLNARYMPKVNSPDYLKRVCHANIVTGATPAIHNDRAVIQALTSKKDKMEHARDYAVVGCVEPCSNGRHYGHSGALLLNLTSALELTLYNGRHRHTGMDRLVSEETGDPRGFQNFEQFKQAFKKQVEWLSGAAVRVNNALGRAHQDHYPTPILSALFEGPMEKGKDLIDGGAAINSSGAAIIGLADVTDCLAAIQKTVFQDKTVTFDELLDAVDNDFKGQEALQVRLSNPEKTPKYGNEKPEADGVAAWIVQMVDDFFSEKENYRGGKYRVGYWSMTNHAGFGRLTKALPNGRKAHENFSSGITPVSGATPHLTQALNSVASLPGRCLSNGVALNLKYIPELKNETRPGEMVERFAATVEGYFDETRRGGLEIQFNITDHDSLVDAARHPEKHPELLVRVSGYTAYFKDLNPQMQKEIIDRTEYLLSTSSAVPHDPFPLP